MTDDELAAAGGAVSDRRPGGLEIGAVLLLLFGGMAGLPPWLAIPIAAAAIAGPVVVAARLLARARRVPDPDEPAATQLAAG